MKFIDSLKNKTKNLFLKEKNGYSLQELNNLDFPTSGINTENIEMSSDLAETVYFICVKHLSETMAKMPWERLKINDSKGKIKDFDKNLDYLLNLRPNPYMSASTFWGTVELNKLHHGNSFVYIETSQWGIPKNLWLLPSEEVEIWIDDKGIFGRLNSIWYVWSDLRSGKQYRFEKNEIVHLKTSVSFDGLSGVPIRNILATQISTQKNSVAFLNKLYKNNMFGSKVMVWYAGDLEKAKGVKAVSEIVEFSKSYSGGKFIPMPFGTEAKMLDMKLADAQFFENNKISSLQLASAFGIKPNIINDYTKSSYSNSESQQIDFYVNTLQPLFLNYEQELTYKLLTKKQVSDGYRLELNEKTLFKMDSKTQAEVYSKYLSNFGMTPNEVREEIGLPHQEGGNELIGNGATINIKNIGNQYNKGGD